MILAFIGAKLVIHAMHTNELSWINGGEHITVVPEIPTWLSLAVILLTLAATTVTSLRHDRQLRERRAARDAVPAAVVGPDQVAAAGETAAAEAETAAAAR